MLFVAKISQSGDVHLKVAVALSPNRANKFAKRRSTANNTDAASSDPKNTARSIAGDQQIRTFTPSVVGMAPAMLRRF
jgi:hypothetical protein